MIVSVKKTLEHNRFPHLITNPSISLVIFTLCKQVWVNVCKKTLQLRSYTGDPYRVSAKEVSAAFSRLQMCFL